MRYLILVLFSLVSFSLPVQAKEIKHLLDIQEVKSAAGITAWLVEDHSLPIISMQFSFKGAGAENDPVEKQGLARLVSNTMDEGAGEINAQDFQKALRDHSISLSYGASRDVFSGSLKTLGKYQDKAFELLKLSLNEPRFDVEAVDRMRAANQSRIRSSLSDPKWIAARLQNDRVFEGDAYALNSGGTLTSLEAITVEDLKQFHRAQLGRNNLVIAVAGDITPDELAVVLDDVFGGLPQVDAAGDLTDLDLQNQGKTYLYEKDIPQTIIEILQPGIDKKDPDYHTAQVMNYILGASGFGSRLMEEIREERGLTYGIYSYFINMERFNGLAVATSTENKNVDEMLGLIRQEWDKMKAEPPSEEEVIAAKNYLTGSLPLSLTSTGKISGIVLSLLNNDLPMDYLDRRDAAIRRTSAQDIHRVAQELLDGSKMVTILVGNPGDLTGDADRNVIQIKELPNVE